MKITFEYKGTQYKGLIIDDITNAIFERGKIEMIFEIPPRYDRGGELHVYVVDNSGEMWCIVFINKLEACSYKVGNKKGSII